MPKIAWTSQLSVDHPLLDGTHREFIDRLGALEEAVANAPEQIAEVLAELIAHTEAHFAQEEAWMAHIGFQDGNCHAHEHRDVLELMRVVRERHSRAADVALVGQLVAAVDQWVSLHAPKHDAGLVNVMRIAGFEPAGAAPQAIA